MVLRLVHRHSGLDRRLCQEEAPPVRKPGPGKHSAAPRGPLRRGTKSTCRKGSHADLIVGLSCLWCCAEARRVPGQARDDEGRRAMPAASRTSPWLRDGEGLRKTTTYFAAVSLAGRVQPFLYFSNQARIAEAWRPIARAARRCRRGWRREP